MNEKLLIVDGSALLSTCYHGNLPPQIKFNKNHEEDYKFFGYILHSSKGVFTNGAYSFMTRLEKMLKEQAPTHVAITFDITRDTFRKKMYPDYKGTRKESPQPLSDQKRYMPQMLSEMGFKVFASNDYEGDDIIGSLSERFRQEIPVRIFANDRDMMQLVKPGVQLWYTTQSQDRANSMYLDYSQGKDGITLASLHVPDNTFPFGRDSVKWYMGVYPEQVPDLKGLSGDSSDNIPGVKGISDKTAAILLSEYGTMEELFKVVKSTPESQLKEEWKTKLGFKVSPIKKLLAEDAEEKARLSKKLATIVTMLHFPITLDDLRLNINEMNREKWYRELEFNSLLMKNKTVA